MMTPSPAPSCEPKASQGRTTRGSASQTTPDPPRWRFTTYTRHMLITTKACRVCGAMHTGSHGDLKAHFYARADDSRKLFNTCRPCHNKVTGERIKRAYRRNKAVRLAALVQSMTNARTL